jgi:hypothetical protein
MPRRGTAKRQYQSGNDQYTYLLLHGDSANDKSVMGGAGAGYAFTNSNVTFASAGYPVGPKALSFNGTNACLQGTIAVQDYYMGGNDYTVEGYFNASNISNEQCLLGASSSSAVYDGWTVGIGLTSSGSFGLHHYINGGGNSVNAETSTGGIVAGTTYHFACCRDGSTIRTYLNGIQVASASCSSAMNQASMASLCIGSGYGGYYFGGWMQELRISVGKCRYPNGTTFAVPGLFGPDAR